MQHFYTAYRLQPRPINLKWGRTSPPELKGISLVTSHDYLYRMPAMLFVNNDFMMMLPGKRRKEIGLSTGQEWVKTFSFLLERCTLWPSKPATIPR
jgi:hypothetical protein